MIQKKKWCGRSRDGEKRSVIGHMGTKTLRCGSKLKKLGDSMTTDGEEFTNQFVIGTLE